MATRIPAAGGSMPVDDPTDLDRADYVLAMKNTLKEVKDDDVPGLAAGVAFKIFLSIFPGLIAAAAIFGIVTSPSEMAGWLDQAQGFLPAQAIELLRAPLDRLARTKESAASLTAIAGVATGLFTATSAAVSLMRALSRAYDVKETRKFVRQRTIALALTVALVAALGAIVLLLVVGRQVQETLLPNVPGALDWLMVAARFSLALTVLILLFAFVYWAGPNRDHPSWVWMSPGAVIGVIGWLLVSGGFTLYVRNFADYAAYGAIAGVVVLLLWLQLSMLMILIGAEFNAEVERLRALHLRVGEGAGFAAPAASAMPHGDVEAGTATIAESQTSAHAITLPASEVEPTLEMPAPSLLPPITETEPTIPLSSDSVPPPVTEADPTVRLVAPGAPTKYAGVTPPPEETGSQPGGGQPSVRQAGAAAAAVTALAVFLGFARRRSRR